MAVANDDNKTINQDKYIFDTKMIVFVLIAILSCIVVTMLKHIEIYPHA